MPNTCKISPNLVTLIKQVQKCFQADSWNVAYIETSAKTRENVDKTFYDLLRSIRTKKLNQKNSNAEKGNSPNGTTKCCCILL